MDNFVFSILTYCFMIHTIGLFDIYEPSLIFKFGIPDILNFDPRPSRDEWQTVIEIQTSSTIRNNSIEHLVAELQNARGREREREITLQTRGTNLSFYQGRREETPRFFLRPTQSSLLIPSYPSCPFSTLISRAKPFWDKRTRRPLHRGSRSFLFRCSSIATSYRSRDWIPDLPRRIPPQRFALPLPFAFPLLLALASWQVFLVVLSSSSLVVFQPPGGFRGHPRGTYGIPRDAKMHNATRNANTGMHRGGAKEDKWQQCWWKAPRDFGR